MSEQKSEKQMEQEQEYAKKVKELTPTHNLPKEMFHAFLVGGLICTLGQFITNTAVMYGLSKEDAATVCTILLILLSIVLTGCNIYPGVAKFGGAGALVPITGFANSVAAPAIEFQKDE